MIETERLTRAYGDHIALQDLTLRVEPGEILGFLGPNGAGKTTTVKILTGMIQPTSGAARVAGFDVVADPLEVKRRVGYVPETGALYESLTPDEYLDLVSSLHHLEAAAAASRKDELLHLFGLAKERRQRMAELSKGMKQKIVIAAALIHRPAVLFLDEPLHGLDANAALLVKALVRKMAAQGRTIFFCSHILEVVERICTRIVIIHNGRQIAAGDAAEITRQTGARTLEEAFGRLTGVRAIDRVADEFLRALDRA